MPKTPYSRQPSASACGILPLGRTFTAEPLRATLAYSSLVITVVMLYACTTQDYLSLRRERERWLLPGPGSGLGANRGEGEHLAGLLLRGQGQRAEGQERHDHAVPEDVQHVRRVGEGAGPDHADERGGGHVERQHEPRRAVLEREGAGPHGDGAEHGAEAGREDRQELPLVGAVDGRDGHTDRRAQRAEDEQVTAPVAAHVAHHAAVPAARAGERSGHEKPPEGCTIRFHRIDAARIFCRWLLAPKPLLRIRRKLYHLYPINSTILR